MLTSLAMTLVLSCAKLPYPVPHVEPVRPVSLACEGPDRVERDMNGSELRRFSNSCTVARCEGSDFVRRTLEGVTTQRVQLSPSCMVTRCEGFDQVRRDTNGRELERVQLAFRCTPRPQPTTTPAESPLRFGLSMR